MADDMKKHSDEDSEDRSAYVVSTGVEMRSAAVDGVDFGQRVITMLAMPYEQSTKVPFRQEIWNEVFSRTAFNGIETRKRRIPATAVFEIPAPDHRGGRLCGRVVGADPAGQSGLVTEVKISRTELGDEALELARDDALSASVGFMVKDPFRDQELDRRTHTRRVNRAFLDHLALVGQPAYNGTGVLAMRSSGIAEADLPPLPPTPRLDEYLNDPILRWAIEKCR